MVKLELVERKPLTRPATNERPAIGVIEAISTGFDTVVRHPWLMLIPFVLDLFLWIGPRLEAGALYDQLAPTLKQMSAGLDTDGQLALQAMSRQVQQFFTQFNLLSWMSVSLIGVPTLNTSIEASARLVTGSGPVISQVGDFDTYFILLMVLSALGLFISGFFWAMLGRQVRGEPFDMARWLKNGAAIGLKLLLFAAGTLFGLLMIFIPMSFITLIVGAISTALASLIPALLLAFVMWTLFYCVFTVHGMTLYRWPLPRALRLSVLIGRVYFAPTLGLLALSVAIYIGLGLIWNSIAPDSLLRLIGMIGNAFIATGLILASLIYYQNRSTILFDRLHLPQPTGS